MMVRAAMPPSVAPRPARKLTGWEEIAMHLAVHHIGKCSAKTAKRYVEAGLPVSRFGNGPVVADVAEVDEWARARLRRLRPKR